MMVLVGYVVDKVAQGQIFSEYYCFPCQSSFHRYFILICNICDVGNRHGQLDQRHNFVSVFGFYL
jgi:hypothetical protein